MDYRFEPRIQLAYGLLSAAASLAILFIVLGKWDWITALTVGIGNFLIAGFYTNSNCKKC